MQLPKAITKIIKIINVCCYDKTKGLAKSKERWYPSVVTGLEFVSRTWIMYFDNGLPHCTGLPISAGNLTKETKVNYCCQTKLE